MPQQKLKTIMFSLHNSTLYFCNFSSEYLEISIISLESNLKYLLLGAYAYILLLLILKKQDCMAISLSENHSIINLCYHNKSIIFHNILLTSFFGAGRRGCFIFKSLNPLVLFVNKNLTQYIYEKNQTNNLLFVGYSYFPDI